MRFDGYYLLSDYLGVNNLQDRSFALAKWKLREILFDLKHPAPEQLRPKTQKTLIYFAWATWIYRFFLFLAIALLVYYFFFKLAGIFLMIVELFWFIFMPVYREVKTWNTFSNDMSFNRNTLSVSLLLMALMVMLLIPWQSVVYLPSVAMYDKKMTLYSPEDGKLEKLYVKNDQFVARGQVLFEISSENLDHEISQTQQQLEINKRLLEKVQISNDQIEDLFIAEQRYLETESALKGLLAQRDKMIVRAGFDGKIVDMTDDIYPGMYLNHKNPIADLVAVDSLVVESYFFEEQLSRLSDVSETAVFYPAILHQAAVDVSLVSIDDSSTDELSQAMLASVYQGDIPVVQGQDGVLKPEQAVYRAVFKPDQAMMNTLDNKIKGTIHINVESVSLIRRAWDHVVMIFLRESGF
jgi:putative peptide zinc metalloprotease protein